MGWSTAQVDFNIFSGFQKYPQILFFFSLGPISLTFFFFFPHWHGHPWPWSFLFVSSLPLSSSFRAFLLDNLVLIGLGWLRHGDGWNWFNCSGFVLRQRAAGKARLGLQWWLGWLMKHGFAGLGMKLWFGDEGWAGDWGTWGLRVMSFLYMIGNLVQSKCKGLYVWHTDCSGAERWPPLIAKY